MVSKVLILLALVSLVAADDLSNGGEGTNLELAKGYSFSTLIDSSGKPAGAMHAYLGGKLSQLPGQQPTYYSDGSNYVSDCNLAPISSGLWLSQLSSVSYFVAGVAAAISIWYVCSIATKKNISDLVDLEKLGGAKKEVAEKVVEEAKSRRRRAIRKDDDEMTRLATIVLTAVQSGECLQKSICLMGSQVSTKKGRLADSLLSTLLPPSIQESDYYIILRKSLRGELSCERFGCPH